MPPPLSWVCVFALVWLALLQLQPELHRSSNRVTARAPSRHRATTPGDRDTAGRRCSDQSCSQPLRDEHCEQIGSSSRFRENQRSMSFRLIRACRATSKNLSSSVYPLTRLQSQTRCLHALAQTAPSAMRPGASSSACCKTNLVAGDHEHCRRPSIVAIEAKQFERGPFLFASRAFARNPIHRREFSLPMYPGDHSP